ncbi:MAG: elongation factor 1-beta [Candidatus Iainarchaeum sp.]|jgi:translation elongation factor EF-1beta|nr:MAG: Elongation factor 1-beta [archaeon ADurb.Bin336]
MGKIMVIFKVFTDPENLDAVEKSLKEITQGEFKDLKREPIGFGIEVIRVGYLISDKEEGVMNKLEEAVKAVPLINEAEIEVTTIIS